jgi:hypothetical protein
LLIATQQLCPPKGILQHNYHRIAVTTRSTVSITTPPIVASAASSDGNGDGLVAATATDIKQEPGIAGEVTLNR